MYKGAADAGRLASFCERLCTRGPGHEKQQRRQHILHATMTTMTDRLRYPGDDC